MSRSDPASPPQLPRAASKRTNLVRFELTSLLLEADYHESWGFHKAVVERFANMRIDAKALRAMGVVQVRLWWACCGLESTAPVGAAAGPSQQRIRHPMEEEEEESTAPALGRLREEALLLFGGKTGSAVKRRQSMFESYKTEAASLALMAAELVDSEAQWSQTQGPGGSNKCNHSIELLKQARAACGHFFGPRNHLAELFDQANEELCAFLRVQSSECIRGPRALPLATTRFGEPTTTCSLSGINMLTRGGPSGANYHPPHDPDDRELQEALAQSLKMDRDRELEEAELQEAVALSLNMVVPANMTSALSNYEIFHQLKPGLVTREQVAASSAGINGWAIMNPQTARHEAEEDGCPSPCEAWDGWMVLDEDKEVASEDELQDRCPVQPCGDKEEEQSLQRALLASLGVVTFSVLDDDHDDHDHDHRAMQALQEAYERLAIEAKVKEAIQADNTNAAVKALMAVAKEHQLQYDDLFGFIFNSVLDANAVKQVRTTHKARPRVESVGVLLKLYKASNDKKKTQQFLLEFVQDLVTDSPHAEALLSQTSYLLEALYDINLLEEEVLLTWHEKGSKQKAGCKVRGAAEPFVNWLKEAEEEDSDDDVDLEAVDE